MSLIRQRCGPIGSRSISAALLCIVVRIAGLHEDQLFWDLYLEVHG